VGAHGHPTHGLAGHPIEFGPFVLGRFANVRSAMGVLDLGEQYATNPTSLLATSVFPPVYLVNSRTGQRLSRD
jgi:hypothetical protein